jgi:hypothetical protein
MIDILPRRKANPIYLKINSFSVNKNEHKVLEGFEQLGTSFSRLNSSAESDLQGNNNIRIHAQYSPALIGSCKQEI